MQTERKVVLLRYPIFENQGAGNGLEGYCAKGEGSLPGWGDVVCVLGGFLVVGGASGEERGDMLEDFGAEEEVEEFGEGGGFTAFFEGSENLVRDWRGKGVLLKRVYPRNFSSRAIYPLSGNQTSIPLPLLDPLIQLPRVPPRLPLEKVSSSPLQ